LKKQSNEELNDPYFSPNIIRVIKFKKMKLTGPIVRMGEGISAYRVSVRNPEGKRPLGRPRLEWEDNIKMDLQEMRWAHGLD